MLAGCASGNAGAPRVTTSAAATASPAASTTGAYESSLTTTIDVTIAGGKVSPSGEKVNVTKGQRVIFTVTSDTDDEVHIHTPGDGVELGVKAGKTATGQVVFSDIGSFEVESHTLNKIIAIFNVR